MRSVLINEIVGVVLAGGKSSRMGTDKAKLIYQGNTLLNHMKKTLLNAGIKKVFISDKDHLPDIIPAKGPLGGLYSVFKKHSGLTSIIIAPVDMPMLSTMIIKRLIEEAAPYEAAYYENNIFPLKLNVSEKIVRYLNHMVEKNHEGLAIKKLLAKLDVKILSIPDEDKPCFININTPDQWNNLKPLQQKSTQKKIRGK